ncbi:MAG: M48 family metallopeptidase [Cyanobacteria bacterium J06632_3]
MPIELPPGTAAYSDETPPPGNSQLLQLALLFLAGLIGAIALAVWLSGAVVWLIPPEVEQQLGRAIVPAFEAQAEPSDTQDELNRLLDGLEIHLPEAQRDGRDYQVLYVPEETVNALAIPGDRIIIYQGLLAEAESENEVMMVLGHELGHFANRDHLRGLSRQLMVRLSLSAFFGDLGALGAIASNSVSSLTNAQFSQSQEIQADEVGLDLLAKAYGHVAGATDFFIRIKQESVPGIALLASHPPSEARVRKLNARIAGKGYERKDKTPLPAPLRF